MDFFLKGKKETRINADLRKERLNSICVIRVNPRFIYYSEP